MIISTSPIGVPRTESASPFDSRCICTRHHLIEVTLRSVAACTLVRSWLIVPLVESVPANSDFGPRARFDSYFSSPFAFSICRRFRRENNKEKRKGKIGPSHATWIDPLLRRRFFHRGVLANSCSANGKLFSRTVN